MAISNMERTNDNGRSPGSGYSSNGVCMRRNPCLVAHHGGHSVPVLGPALLFYRTLSPGGVPHNTASNSDKKGSTSTLRQTERKATS